MSSVTPENLVRGMRRERPQAAEREPDAPADASGHDDGAEMMRLAEDGVVDAAQQEGREANHEADCPVRALA